ncbi:Ktr system potassium transporter B [Massilia sp. CCM 8733]|uniref:Ktr system potassium transporter B n=1 Tax=Massilia mucilaginosa TaxID=2609282 RepID=A0ABX0NY08_9BURK|nr:Ktr system potassium transporter B [Massilia mucilaginosa]
MVQQLEKRLFSLRPPQALLLSFIGLSLAGALLLKSPWASHTGTSWSQALFTAVSAATVTGLAVVDTGTHFTLFGQWVLLFLMQFGGLGLMTFGVFIIYLAQDRLSMQHRATLSEALNEPGHGNLHSVLRAMFGFTIVMEAAGTVLLSFQWVPELGWSKGIYYSFFHAVSAFNNAGFSLRADSLVAYAGSPLVNSVISLLFISGGIGFGVIADVTGKRRFRDYALHTKAMLVGTLCLNLVAMLVVLALEYGNPATLGALPEPGARLWAAWFQGVAPRTAGFNSVDMAAMLPATAFFIMGLMFIGGGSGSTASGIKLSTFIVMLVATRAFLRSEERPVLFGRSVDPGLILKAMSIGMISLFCVVTGTFLLTITEKAPFIDIAFEAVSAFGTVGLSRGLTASLTLPGQAVIMVLMLIGRVGPLTLAFTLANRDRARIQYPVGKLTIG